MVFIVRDITSRKQTEAELLASRRQLVDIIDFLPDATLAIDREKKVIIWNRAIEKMTGDIYKAVGKSVLTRFAWVVGASVVGFWLWAKGKGLIP